jgi:hypothetical protein
MPGVEGTTTTGAINPSVAGTGTPEGASCISAPNRVTT